MGIHVLLLPSQWKNATLLVISKPLVQSLWVIMGWQPIIPWKCLLALLIFCSYGLFIAKIINEWMKWSNFWLGGLGKKPWLQPKRFPQCSLVKGAEHPWKSAGAQHPWGALGSSWPWLDHAHNHTTGAAAQRNILVETQDKLKGGNQRETIFRERD